VYAFVIGNPRNEKKINVFKIKDFKIYEHDFETQKEELALSPTF
jgi:hypothetical protein